MQANDMFQNRTNENSYVQADHAQRMSRGYEINGQWYFELRGGGQKGPYDNQLIMQADLNEFIYWHEQTDQQN